MPETEVPESWGQYRRLILNELERLHSDVTDVRRKMDEFRQNDIAEIKTDIALLKFKASLWGGMVGGMSSIVVTVAAILLRVVK